MRYPTALTIAGSDSGGGAGIQADLKTFSALGVFGASVLTALTAQNTREVRGIEAVSVEFIRQQLETVLDDLVVDVVKTGMLVNPSVVKLIADVIDTYNIRQVIIDPVMVSTSGANLTKADIGSAIRDLLYPRLTLLTPNIPETEQLTGMAVRTEKERDAAGKILLEEGCKAVLIKGGHWTSEETSTDVLYMQGQEPLRFSTPFVRSNNMHGTGCSLASAVAAFIARGEELSVAVQKAKDYITNAIEAGANVNFGSGNGPVNHFFNPVPLKAKIQ